jgi:aminoglycoside phosphotransferase (APT) family kinase protein
LVANRPPPPERPVIVHGDLRLGNLVVGEEGIRAVIDWGLVHLGDRLEDLAWVCTKLFAAAANPRHLSR